MAADMVGSGVHKDKIIRFRRRLLDFFRKSGRETLPWRRAGIGAYEVWVSEVMLQQTQVSRVIPYYERFLKRFPTVEALARASWEEFLPYYAGLGYYARGRNMLRTARTVVERHGGRFPRTVAELEALPGIGPYTARAIASFAYAAPVLAWDTNLRRVIGRFFFGGKQRVGEREAAYFESALGDRSREFNAALMDFGSALCVARPKCSACSLRHACRYFREQGKQEARAKSEKSKAEAVAPSRAIVILHEGHRQYFSSDKRRYRPFVLPRGVVTRAAIKEHFETTYGLALAVRPAHGRQTYRGEQAALVHAQILLGQPAFRIFPKSEVVEYTRGVKSA